MAHAAVRESTFSGYGPGLAGGRGRPASLAATPAAAMGRLSLEQASAPSQRASREQRAAEAEAAAWQIKHDEVLKALEEERRRCSLQLHA